MAAMVFFFGGGAPGRRTPKAYNCMTSDDDEQCFECSGGLRRCHVVV